MTAAHTPGPWGELETESSVDLEGCEGWQDIGTADGRVLAIAVGYARFPCDDPEHEANARLITLAPDLFEYVQSSADNGCATAKALVAKATGQ